MDPASRWLRRWVVARAAERLAIEAAIVGLGAALGAVALGWRAAEVVFLLVIAAIGAAVLRLAVAVATNPINHRYLLQWTDPSSRLRPADDVEGGRSDDVLSEELRVDGFAFLVRLERNDPIGGNDGPGGGDGDGGGNDDEPNRPTAGLDLYRTEGGRLVVSRGDDEEITVVSRLDDGRILVTSAGLIPPTERVVVQRAGGRPGQIPTDAVIAHVERLLSLRAEGIEAVVTEPADVVALARIEWESWQDLGPLVGPLIAVGWRRRPTWPC